MAEPTAEQLGELIAAYYYKFQVMNRWLWFYHEIGEERKANFMLSSVVHDNFEMLRDVTRFLKKGEYRMGLVLKSGADPDTAGPDDVERRPLSPEAIRENADASAEHLEKKKAEHERGEGKDLS